MEIGCCFGGSALWFADMMAAHGLTPPVVTVDIDPQVPLVEKPRGTVFGKHRRRDRLMPSSLLAHQPIQRLSKGGQTGRGRAAEDQGLYLRRRIGFAANGDIFFVEAIPR